MPDLGVRPFNPHLRAASDQMKALILEVQRQFEGYEAHFHTRQRNRGRGAQLVLEQTLEAVLCDLCVATHEPNVSQIHLPLSNQVLRKKSRYKGAALGKTLPDILKILAAPGMDFLVMVKGQRTTKIIDDDLNIAFVGGVQTTISAGPKLLSRIESFNISYDDVGPSPEEEVIILRQRKRHPTATAEPQEYEDTDETIRMRAELRSINEGLERANISIDLQTQNTKNRRLRRIFNNSDFGEGGRLYGGFWQTMKSEERLEHILIDDDFCCELDYGQMSLAILYGLTDNVPPDGDLYDLSDCGIPNEYRKGLKIVIQGVINNNKLPERMPKGARKHLPKAVTIATVLRAIEEKHPKIFPMMTSGIGMQLFRKESDILVSVLVALKDKGIVALPIHDAVVVTTERSEETKEIMKRVFRAHTGITPQVTLE